MPKKNEPQNMKKPVLVIRLAGHVELVFLRRG
jgi:hypothetical protein